MRKYLGPLAKNLMLSVLGHASPAAYFHNLIFKCSKARSNFRNNYKIILSLFDMYSAPESRALWLLVIKQYFINFNNVR